MTAKKIAENFTNTWKTHPPPPHPEPPPPPPHAEPLLSLTYYWYCLITGIKSFSLNRSIWMKYNCHIVATGSKWLRWIWFRVVAELSDQNCRAICKSFPDLDVVTPTARLLQRDILKSDRDGVIPGDINSPFARGVAFVVPWIVWTPECSSECCQCPCTLCSEH